MNHSPMIQQSVRQMFLAITILLAAAAASSERVSAQEPVDLSLAIELEEVTIENMPALRQWVSSQ